MAMTVAAMAAPKETVLTQARVRARDASLGPLVSEQ
jgi:hypothetical protein